MAVPMALIGYGVFLLATFVPPTVYDDSMPDPGPENFFFFNDVRICSWFFLPADQYTLIIYCGPAR